jgi:hypothetical protein
MRWRRWHFEACQAYRHLPCRLPPPAVFHDKMDLNVQAANSILNNPQQRAEALAGMSSDARRAFASAGIVNGHSNEQADRLQVIDETKTFTRVIHANLVQ